MEQPKIVPINLRGCTQRSELHERLRAAFTLSPQADVWRALETALCSLTAPTLVELPLLYDSLSDELDEELDVLFALLQRCRNDRLNYRVHITVDLTGCATLYELHERIREAFDFPLWYGANWNAFCDLLPDPAEPTLVTIKGFRTMPAALQEACTPLFELLQDNKSNTFDYRCIP